MLRLLARTYREHRGEIFKGPLMSLSIAAYSETFANYSVGCRFESCWDRHLKWLVLKPNPASPLPQPRSWIRDVPSSARNDVTIRPAGEAVFIAPRRQVQTNAWYQKAPINKRSSIM